jgi:hypothetical protein
MNPPRPEIAHSKLIKEIRTIQIEARTSFNDRWRGYPSDSPEYLEARRQLQENLARLERFLLSQKKKNE